VGKFDPTGSTLVFEVVVDDYAEIWINGQMPRTVGQAGGTVVSGFNSPNRLIVARNIRPGQQFQIAVFGINAPLSVSPQNYIWMRTAALSFYSALRASPARPVDLEIDRKHRGLGTIVPADARLEQIASGFVFTEGPVWTRAGHLLFSSPHTNTIFRWASDGSVNVFRTNSGYSGFDIGEYIEPGANGLTFDREGRLTMCQHGNRQVVRVERRNTVTLLAGQYQGKRLNSPNDLVYKSDGALYFTDPPFGLPQTFDDPRKELTFSGVYRVVDGHITLLTDELRGPNGIAFSPDEAFLYVGNWDPEMKVVMRFPVNADGTLSPGEVFHDLTDVPGENAIDGIKVDQQGNLYVCGPNGIWIFSPEGQALGVLHLPELPHNLAWGDEDGRTIYITARTSVYRIKLNIPGIRP